MIDLHYWTTPNGHKITIFLEETGLPYRIVPVNLQKDEQHRPDYLELSPNGKIPAIVDHDPPGGGEAIRLFESGAILNYLAETSRRLVPKDLRGRLEVQAWLFWQVSSLSPMAGQQGFFRRAKEQIPMAIDRYTKETARLYGVMDRRLADRPYLAGEDFTIADVSAYPWTAPWDMLHQDMDQFAHLERWLDAIARRPAVKKAYAIAREINPSAPMPPPPRAAKPEA